MSRWDDELGRELREMPVPAHEPGYYDRLRARIREARGGGDGGDAHPAAARTLRPAARPITTGAPAGARRRPLPGVRLAALAAVAVAVIAAVAFTWAGLPGIELSNPPAATADTVLAGLQDAYADLPGIRGDVVEYGSARGKPYERRIGSFAFTADGDYRVVSATQGAAYSYEAATRTSRRHTIAGGRVTYTEVTRGLPDPGPYVSPSVGLAQVLDRSTAAYARAVLADLDPDLPVTPAVHEGRKAWSLTVPERLPGGGAQGSVRIVVDAATGYPLVVEHWSPEGEVTGTRVEDLRVGDPLPHMGAGVTSRRADGHVTVRLNEGFRSMTLAEAGTLGDQFGVLGTERRSGGGRVPERFAGYAPDWVPEGYRLDGATGAVNGTSIGAWRAVRGDEVRALTVVLTYRRGFDRFCVVTRWSRDGHRGGAGQFGTSSSSSAEVARIIVTGGALRGEEATVVLGLRRWPHLRIATGTGGRTSVGVAGDLTRAELTRIAESLHPIER